MRITEQAPIEVEVYRSSRDGALVIQIDTQTETGQVRVNLNDGLDPIYQGDPEEDDGDRARLQQIAQWLNETNSLDLSNATRNAKFRANVSVMLYRLNLNGESK